MTSEADGPAIAIEVRREDPATTREVPLQARELEPGEALLRVDSFALTANNVTYAALGETMGYWRFFPASEEGWGRVPVWGFADVVASRAEGLAAGERSYGYFPMATHLRVQADASRRSVFDSVAPHRAELPPFYNRYVRTAADPGYDPALEDLQMLMRPLFATSFLIDDALADAGFHGADAVVLSSASSKTAYGTAYLLAERGAVEVIGLTSPGNADFVRGLGLYDRVVEYGDAAGLDAGRRGLRRHVRRRRAARSAAPRARRAAGARPDRRLHAPRGDDDRPGRPAGARAGDLLRAGPGAGAHQAMGRAGAGGEDRRAWGGFLAWLSREDGPAVLEVERSTGSDEVQRTWQELVAGRSRPNAGHIASLG